MARETILTSEVLRQISAVRSIDLLVGIPTYNNETTIDHVLKAVYAGLAAHFPDARVLVVSSDGGSQDATKSLVNQLVAQESNLLTLSHLPHPIRRIVAPHSRSLGKAHAILTLFEIADSLRAKALAVIDASSTSVTADWVAQLIKPILLEGFDFVAPLYFRHKYDGTITSSLIYPLIRALYGKRIRQPAGDDFGYSGRLVAHCLKMDIWHRHSSRYSLEVWLTALAAAAEFKVCQAFLGPKSSTQREPGNDLSSILNRVLGTVFDLMESNYDIWARVRGSEPTTVYGSPTEVGLDPVEVNLERMIGAFRQGVSDLQSVWQNFLSSPVLEQLRKSAVAVSGQFHFSDGLWVRTVYEFALAFHKNRMARDHLIKSMTPLYLGRIASYVVETRDSTAADVDNRIELLCLEYENLKYYLIEHWRD